MRHLSIVKQVTVAFLCCYVSVVQANVLVDGTVVQVLSGDQLVLANSEQGKIAIHLMGVDAPEFALGHCLKAQPFADIAQKALTERLKGMTVKASCAPALDGQGFAWCELIHDNESINFWLIEQGYAWYNKSEVGNLRLQQAEQSARQRRVGLWLDQLPVTAPWVYRQRCAAPQ